MKYDPANKPEISNLMGIYSHCAGMSLDEIEAKYDGQGYGPFKKDLAEHVVAVIEPIQTRYNEIRRTGEIHDILKQGAERASLIAEKTIAEVKEKMGFLNPRG